MSLVILLDAGPIVLVTNPKRSPESIACTRWLQTVPNFVIATTNVGHLSRFASADVWQNVTVQ